MSPMIFGNISLSSGNAFMPARAAATTVMPSQPIANAVDTTGLKRFWLDIPYANVSKTQNLALFLPNEGEGPFSLIINIHGGGFVFGDKDMGLDEVLRPELAKGFAVASINYRLSSKAIFSAAIEDTKAAIRFFRANAKQDLLNSDRFATWGNRQAAICPRWLLSALPDRVWHC